MLNQWWSYNFHEEETHSVEFSVTSTDFPKIFHFSNTQNPWEKQWKFTRWFPMLNTKILIFDFGITNTLIDSARMQTETATHEQNGLSTWAHNNKAIFQCTRFSHDLSPLMRARRNENGIGIIRCSLYLWKSFTGTLHFFDGKVDNAFHASFLFESKENSPASH